ncbi:uncharacterized protein LOC133842848 isoform X1 [Drosophila sulfurigaster albostrigata]|uniref:uncharacterized protein LOC133842848 isoform X1 n=1 Tax=Drosophila sulfurigaster albostrigata TaxID=89887 RepID=UPI002D21BFE0|nr:uncharacterized protein LOC133842848 isoform X1 [Drosophila sulfurigaster albostrigata]
MRWLTVCLLYTLPIFEVDCNETIVNVRGKVKTIIESVETDCDHDYVEYFDIVPNKILLFTFRVAKVAPSFNLTITTRSAKTKRVMYKITVDGCPFLSNPIINKVLGSTYRKILVNTTFKCPIPPKVYFMKNVAALFAMPAFHPAGQFQMNARVRMPQTNAPFVMDINWKYSIEHLK